ncbi:MAG: hypothetical protein M1824_000323 [Vezdaea acicularis]|nr:MAG: hypothetical protein M1824_000323 [Vezdaea acicularis]
MHPPRIRSITLNRPSYSLKGSGAPRLVPFGSRCFSQRTQLGAINQRVQPFAPSSIRANLVYFRHGAQCHFVRPISTERKQWIRSEIFVAGKWTVFIWASVVLVSVAAFGLRHEGLERQYPSPREWSWRSRMHYREARQAEEQGTQGVAMGGWVTAMSAYRRLLARLEDPAIDGSNLEEQGEGGILVAGIGKAGMDITHKSEPWRRAYFATLFGLAKAVEHLDGHVLDKTRKLIFPAEVVVGPSNPRPRPVEPGAPAAPLEQDCEPASVGPEVYYTKILTTHGFTNRQRLDAALAYGDWLNFKGLPDAAGEMYKWGLDISLSPYSDPSSIVDPKTKTLRHDGPAPSEIVLHALTSLATHHARNSDVASALPIYLSVLRARRSLVEPAQVARQSQRRAFYDDQPVQSNFSALVSLLRFYLIPPEYPPAPATGDETPVRDAAELCEEAGLMAYIGEVLYTSAPASREAGITWTREAVDMAETQLLDSRVDTEEAKSRCQECLETGLDNWSNMVARLVWEEKSRKASAKEGSSWSLGLTGNQEQSLGRWEAEAKVAADRRKKVGQALTDRNLGKTGTGALVIG